MPNDPEERDVPITIGALTASRIGSMPSDARRRWAHSATIIELETGRDYCISGGTDWFEIREGVVFTAQQTARVAWDEGTANLGAGMWQVRIA